MGIGRAEMPANYTMKLVGYTCGKCGYTEKTTKLPKLCAKCGSKDWGKGEPDPGDPSEWYG
jgi:rubrerythrin